MLLAFDLNASLYLYVCVCVCTRARARVRVCLWTGGLVISSQRLLVVTGDDMHVQNEIMPGHVRQVKAVGKNGIEIYTNNGQDTPNCVRLGVHTDKMQGHRNRHNGRHKHRR